MKTITVIKRDHLGGEVLRYSGELVSRGATWLCLQARFAHDDVDIGVMVFRRGDLMTEWFYTDRYYNVFQIQDVNDGHIKGWYCNLTRPARISKDVVSADDLALDVYVAPKGVLTVLDEDEFQSLHLSPQEVECVDNALADLRQRVEARIAPFDVIV